MKKKQKLIIKSLAYFGGAVLLPDDPYYAEVAECARYLADKGYHTINGGGPGVMKASTEGAHLGGGKVTGVTFYSKDMALFEGRDTTNLIDKEVITKNYVERTLTMLSLADAYLIFRGGTGTISEFGMAWGLAKLYYGHHKPMILYGNYWKEIVDSFNKHMDLGDVALKVYYIVDTPQAAYKALVEFEEKHKNHKHTRTFNRNEKGFQI
jgi:predicted Rossmann-fold nucleotide-binding protein